jgi:P2 family phage contractile tail tube protein
MAARFPKMLKNYNVHIEGVGYTGLATELKIPNLEFKQEEHRAGGLDHPLPVDLGQEKMEMEMTFSEVNPTLKKLVGIHNGGKTRVMCYGALNDDMSPASDPVVIKMEGKFTKHEHTGWKAGEKTEEKYTFHPLVYEEIVAGDTTTMIDTLGMKRVIGGTDYLEQIRANIHP